MRRALIPDATRKQLDIRTGDLLFVHIEDTGAIPNICAENSYDILADHALREGRAGRSRSLRDIAWEKGVDLDSE